VVPLDRGEIVAFTDRRHHLSSKRTCPGDGVGETEWSGHLCYSEE
jgi:hypothetical protein